MSEHPLYRKRVTDPSAGPSIDDIVAKNAVGRLRKELGPIGAPPKPPSGGGSQHAGHKGAAGGPPGSGGGSAEDTDLLASMAKRLSQLEKDLKYKSRELERAHQETEALRAKVAALSAAASSDVSRPSSQVASPLASPAGVGGESALRAENRRLQHEVSELKKFLADYGMVWVGPAGDAAPGAAVPLQPHPPSHAADPSRPPDAKPPRSDFRRRSYTDGASLNGAPGVPGPPPRSSSSGGAAPPAGQERPPFRISDLISRLDELNQLAGDGIGQLVPSGAGAQARVLQTPDPVRLSIFRDGLQLHRDAPKAYTEPGPMAVLKDILDGYFPSQLRREFPNGVPIKLVDRSTESYQDAASPRTPAGGAGGGAGGSAGSNVRSFHDIDARAGDGAAMNRAEFLSRLPNAVIRNGKVIEVRAGVGKVLGVPPAGDDAAKEAAPVSLVASPVDVLLTTSQRNHKGPVLPPPSREAGGRPAGQPAGAGEGPGPGTGEPLKPPSRRSSHTGSLIPAAPLPAPAGPSITTLQVKSEDGQETFIIKLMFDDTIVDLRRCIDAHRAKGTKDAATKCGYEVRSAFPPRKYDDPTETLRAAGLTPNATLFLRSVTPAA